MNTTSYFRCHTYVRIDSKPRLDIINPLSLHDALKHHFTSLKTDLIFLQPRGFRNTISTKLLTDTWQMRLVMDEDDYGK